MQQYYLPLALAALSFWLPAWGTSPQKTKHTAAAQAAGEQKSKARQALDSGVGNEAFEQFVKGTESDFEAFRQRVLAHYADFLGGEWHEYEAMPGLTRYSVPKPTAPPSIDDEPSVTASSGPKTEVAPKSGKRRPSARIVDDGSQPAVCPEPIVSERVEVPPVVDAPQPEEVPQPSVATRLEVYMGSGRPFDFYGMTVSLPVPGEMVVYGSDKWADQQWYRHQWRKYDKAGLAEAVLPELRRVTESMNLNDYLTYQLVRHYAVEAAGEQNLEARVTMAVYLLAHLGYEVKIGTSALRSIPVVLLASDQIIYGKNMVSWAYDKNGRGMTGATDKPVVYYAFIDDGIDQTTQGLIEQQRRFYIPSEVPYLAGKEMDFKINGLNLPYKPYPFEVTDGTITLRGELNANLFPLTHRYPQMTTASYSLSSLMPGFYDDLARQFREQLEDRSELDAINTMLRFVMNGFEYASDQDPASHGFEKPYFIEENFFYPRNDCEDRAIFYTYFLDHALGVENQMLHFPGHESAAVRLSEPINGNGYTYGGDKTFYISDPTYFNSVTGNARKGYNMPPMKAIDIYYHDGMAETFE